MALVDNGNIIIVIGTVIILGQEMQNVYDVQVSTGAGGAALADMSTATRSWMRALYTHILPDITTAVSFDRIQVINRSQGTEVGTFSWDTSGGWTPGGASEPLPLGVSALVTLPTTAARTRGRKFFMGYTEGNNNSLAEWSTGAQNRLTSLGAWLLTAQPVGVAGMSWRYVVVREGVGAFTFYTPTGANVSAIPAYQRRRKQGVGR